jgi:hypothetical protein
MIQAAGLALAAAPLVLAPQGCMRTAFSHHHEQTAAFGVAFGQTLELLAALAR